MSYDFYRTAPPEQAAFDAVVFSKLTSRRTDADQLIIRAAVIDEVVDVSACLIPKRQISNLYNSGVGVAPYLSPVELRYGDRKLAFKNLNPHIVAAAFFLLRDQHVGLVCDFPDPHNIGSGVWEFTQHSSPFRPEVPYQKYHPASYGVPGVLLGAAALRTAWCVCYGRTISDFSVNERAL